MPLQERDELFLKGDPPMVLGLAGEIGLDPVEMRIAYRERAVAGLPGETGQRVGKGLVLPTGGTGFDDANRLRDRQSPIERHEEMHVIRHPASRHQGTTFGSEDAADVVEKPRLDL